ncbi:MAG: gfo/Idh/MocA family oxidoreductase [Chloroflexota bacterium]|nr:MAG: gfo/Idh/MocA family oxidoreductase [Chloroflexota bacterium]
MKFLLAGLGSVGRRHLRNLAALGESDILLYRTHHSTLPDSDLAGYPVETDLRAALAQRPEAVIIANPTAMHLDVAIPAARAGCHLLLEKPVSHTLDRVDALAAAARQTNAQILVGFQYRFHAGLAVVRRLLSEGAIGRPVSARAHYGEYLPGWHPWEDYRQSYSARSQLGGGVTLTLSHPLDYLRWLFGEVDCLWSLGGQLSGLDLDVDDVAEVGMQFSSGMIASVHLDYIQRPTTRSLEVIGEQGTLRWDDIDGTARLYRAPATPQEKREWEVYPPPPGFDRNDMFLAEMRHFISVVNGESAPACTLEDGLRALQLSLAARESYTSGQRVTLRGT